MMPVSCKQWWWCRAAVAAWCEWVTVGLQDRQTICRCNPAQQAAGPAIQSDHMEWRQLREQQPRITSANINFASLNFLSFTLERCLIEKVLRNTEVMIPSRTTRGPLRDDNWTSAATESESAVIVWNPQLQPEMWMTLYLNIPWLVTNSRALQQPVRSL